MSDVFLAPQQSGRLLPGEVSAKLNNGLWKQEDEC